jgi:hypothetical protein
LVGNRLHIYILDKHTVHMHGLGMIRPQGDSLRLGQFYARRVGLRKADIVYGKADMLE